MREFSGRFTPVEEISKTLSRGLDQALESPDPIAAMETALLSVEKTSRGLDGQIAEAVRRIAIANGLVDLAALARDLGLSVRQMERRFSAAVGLTPKLFCRIQRFSSVFRAIGDPSGNWVETAIRCGYYDQAHLIRDCRGLSGSTPESLLSEEADLARHFYQLNRRFGTSHSSNTARRTSV